MPSVRFLTTQPSRPKLRRIAAVASPWDFTSNAAQVLAEVPKRLAVLAPELVVLFGSRARGDAQIDSDYDLLVVMDVGDPSGARSVPVRRLLRGLGVPFDIVVYTPAEWASYRRHPQALAHRIAREGRVLHGSL